MPDKSEFKMDDEGLIKDINPISIESAYISAPFDEGKQILARKGYEIISLEECAKLRMHPNGKPARNGNWVREGIIFVPDNGFFLTKNSPILEDAQRATDCHRRGTEYYLTDGQVERALADSVRISEDRLILPTSNAYEAYDRNRPGLENYEIALFAFGNYTRDYGKFLKEENVGEWYIFPVMREDREAADYLFDFARERGEIPTQSGEKISRGWIKSNRAFARQMFFTYEFMFYEVADFMKGLDTNLCVRGIKRENIKIGQNRDRKVGKLDLLLGTK